MMIREEHRYLSDKHQTKSQTAKDSSKTHFIELHASNALLQCFQHPVPPDWGLGSKLQRRRTRFLYEYLSFEMSFMKY